MLGSMGSRPVSGGEADPELLPGLSPASEQVCFSGALSEKLQSPGSACGGCWLPPHIPGCHFSPLLQAGGALPCGGNAISGPRTGPRDFGLQHGLRALPSRWGNRFSQHL